MIELITDKTGWPFAVVAEDTHLAKWSREQKTLTTDPTVEAKLCPLIKPGDCVVDAGACIGDHTVAYARAVGPMGKVYAFEPSLESFVCLKVNCRDMPWVDCLYGGLSDQFASAMMFHDPNIGKSHVHSEIRDGGKGYGWPSLNPLDIYSLPRCNFLKIDVEGFEPKVITGAEQTIRECRPIIYCEVNHRMLRRYGFNYADHIEHPLVNLGYRMELENPSHGLDTPETNVFFFPK